MITQEEENHLLNRILAGESAAYARLVREYKNLAFTIALKIVNNKPEAEEVAQDAFIKAFQNLKKFNREARFKTWLYRIVFNTAISYKRKSKAAFYSIEHAQIPVSEQGGRDLQKADQVKFLHEAMQTLAEADRLALQLFYLNEFSLEEVATMMSQPANTVKVRVHRARLRLADELKRILNKEALTL
ncbi:MAG: sigma-70 family RNA polymerase sigma factor [Cytophagales bacterium]|nr:sigma-70 family RNA polymerase sigma factor [Cytophagales bacterium]